MKTLLVMYMLAFVSIIVIYVHDRDLPADEYLEPHTMAAQVLQLQRGPGGITVKVRPEKPEAAAPPKKEKDTETDAGKSGDMPEIVDLDHYPHTFEGLDQKIKEYSASAEVNPDLYVNISECYSIKADMYQARIRSLKSFEPGEQRKAVHEELER